MDRLQGAFTMATAAAACGLSTTIFFSFWSLSVLREKPSQRKKGLWDRIFSALLPRGPEQLPNSKMNFAGLGPKLFRWRMKQKQVSDLSALLKQAQALGISFLACENSADMLGIHQDELVEGVKLAGAATCLQKAAAAEIALFI